MTNEQFLQQFGHFVNAPNGIEQLRTLVLRLAITGGFSEPLANAHEVDQMMSELQQRKAELVKEKTIRNLSVTSPKPLLSEPVLPQGWKWCRVLDMCTLMTGATPSRQKAEYFGGDIKWLVSGDIHKGEIFDCEGRITEEGLDSSNCKLLPKDSVLIALNGQGKTRATVALLRTEAACNQSLVSMTTFDKRLLLPEFLYLNLKSRYFEIRDITGQKQRRGLNMKLVGELSVSLCPVDEQHRIVAKVDELMVLCDQLETERNAREETHQRLIRAVHHPLTEASDTATTQTAWHRIRDNFADLYTTRESVQALRQTILQIAMQGKLLPQEGGDESALKLLERINAEKERLIKEKRIKKNKYLKAIDPGDELFAHPAGWAWARFGTLVNFKSELVKPNDYLGLEQIAPDSIEKGTGKLLLRRTVKESGVTGPNNHFYEGQILYSKIRPSLSKAVIAPCDGLCSADMYPLEPLIDAEFLLRAMLSEVFLEQVRVAENRIKMPKLNIDSLSNILVPVPPISEQHRIVKKLNDLMAICDQLETQVDAKSDAAVRYAEAAVHQIAAA